MQTRLGCAPVGTALPEPSGPARHQKVMERMVEMTSAADHHLGCMLGHGKLGGNRMLKGSLEGEDVVLCGSEPRNMCMAQTASCCSQPTKFPEVLKVMFGKLETNQNAGTHSTD